MSHHSILPPEPDPDDLRDSHVDQFRRLVEEDGAASSSDVERLVDTLAAHGGGDLSYDLALDILLNAIVEQARLATGASGAAIALVKDQEMVCRATSGPTAPDLGVRLDTRSGLSGACVATGLIQLCADTEVDPRVDALASRQLGVRSILVLPLLEGGDILGVFEIFSPRPHAFGERDIHTLEALARRILNDRQRAVSHLADTGDVGEPYVEVGVQYPTSDLGPSIQQENQPKAGSSSATVVELTPKKAEARRLTQSNIDVTTAILASLVIAAGIGLGLLIGWRSGAMAVLTGTKKQTTSPIPATVKQVKSPGVPTAVPPVPATPDAVHVASAAPRDESVARTRARGVGATGGLVVFENGKEIFRMLPTDAGHRTEAQSHDSATSNSLATLDADAANARLIHRIEPEYPTAANAISSQDPVVLDVVVGTDGVVETLTVVSGEAALSNSAMVAVRQWHYQPLVINGKNTSFRTRVSLTFPPRAN